VTKPVENDGTWNIYKDIVLESEELRTSVDASEKLMVTREELHSYKKSKESM